MAKPELNRPTTFGRRQFLRIASGTTAALLLPVQRALAQTDGGMLMWLPGGSNLFCEIHTGLLERFVSQSDHSSTAETICGLGQDAEYTQALIGSIASGNPPNVSMLWESPIALGLQGAFMPLDDMMANSNIGVETWPEGLLASTQFNGVTYGLPVTAGVYSMWYNQELFEEKGIPSDRESFPSDWSEMRRLSKEFTVWNGDRLEVSGFQPPRTPETIPVWSALNGGKLYDAENRRYTIDSEQNIEMFTFFLEWLDEEYRGDINLVDRSGNFTTGYADAVTGLGPAFREGRLAGLQSGSWLMGDIYADPAPTFERWNLAAHPVGPSGSSPVSGTWPNWFVIPTGAANPEAAFDYLSFLSTEGVVEWYAQIPDVPTNKQVEPSTPKGLIDRRGQEFADELTEFLSQQATVATAMWDSPTQSFGNDQIARAIEKIYTKSASVTETLAEAQRASQAELERVLRN